MKLVFGGEETYIACGICRFCTRTETRDVVIPLLLPIVKHVVVLIIVLPRGAERGVMTAPTLFTVSFAIRKNLALRKT